MSGAVFTPTAPTRAGARGRWFYLVMVSLMFLVVGWVEGWSFFLVGFYHPPDFRSEVIHVHVAVVATWLLVLMAQTVLARVNNLALHRRLGAAGAVLAAMMLVMGLLATADMLHREANSTAVAIVPFTQILNFALFAALAYALRRNREMHKRLIVLAMVDPLFGVLIPVTHRYLQSIERFANFSWVILALLVGYDLWTRRRVHPVTVWGSLWLILVQEVRVPIGQTAAWMAIAQWMRSWGV